MNPSTKTTLEMRVLQRAAELLGGERALARRLHVSMPDLFAWLKGAERPTKTHFFAAIDVLIEHGEASVDDSLGRALAERQEQHDPGRKNVDGAEPA